MSFAQEMKDFIAAAQAGQKMIGAASDEDYKKVKKRYMEAQSKTIEDKNNDTEGQELDRQIKKNNVAKGNAAIRSSDALTSERNARTKILNAPPAADPMYGGIKANPQVSPPATPVEAAPLAAPAAVAPRQAVPTNDGYPAVPDQEPLNTAGLEEVPTTDTERALMSGAYKNGGAVQHFAEGGSVEEDDTLPAPPPAEAQDAGGEAEVAAEPDEGVAEAVPVSASPTDVSSRSRGTPKFSADAALDAGGAGLKYGVSALGLNDRAAVSDPRRSRSLQAYVRGAGAASPIDMDAARKAVDPDNKLSESQRNLAALGAVYQYKLNKDDNVGAQRAAFSMIQHYRVASQQYAAIAAAAVEKGDLDGAAKAAMKAYANIPDGKDLKVTKTADGKFKYSFTDEKTGKTLEAGIESPDKLAAAAIGFAREGFDQSLLAAAGQRQEKPAKRAVDPEAPMKAADKKSVLAQIKAAYDEQNPDDEKTQKPKRTPADKLVLTGAAFRLAAHSHNARLTPEEAMDVTTKIADPTSLDQAGFATKPAEGGFRVRIDKKEIFVPAADFDALLEKRNAKLKSLEPKKTEPGFIENAVKKIGEFRDDNKRRISSSQFTEPSIP